MNKNRMIIATMMVGSCLLMASSTCAQYKPNLVLVLLANFGWDKAGFNCGGVIRGEQTPRLDQLTGEGLRLTNFNVEMQCTPSRSPNLTDRNYLSPS